MGCRRPFREVSPLLFAAAFLLWCGCTPRASKTAPSLALTAHLPASGTVPVQKAKALRRDLVKSEDHVQELEQQLAERDREIAAVQSQIDAARGDAAAAPGASGAPAAAPQPAPATAPAAAHAPAAPAEPAAAPEAAEAQAPAPADTASAPITAAPAVGSQPGAPAAPDERLAGAQKRIARLEQQLASEVKRRQEVESEMNRLLQETSAGPFEHADNVVEHHLREELDRARKEITELRTTVTSERRDRAELERRFASLQAQVEATSKASAHSAAPSEEVEALKERQRRVLASIQQDLESSKQREAELRQSLEGAQGADGVSLADAVTNLRAENSALQMRLDDEHRRNGDLSAKLQLATRVTDLIFRMQGVGGQPIAAAAPPGGAR